MKSEILFKMTDMEIKKIQILEKSEYSKDILRDYKEHRQNLMRDRDAYKESIKYWKNWQMLPQVNDPEGLSSMENDKFKTESSNYGSTTSSYNQTSNSVKRNVELFESLVDRDNIQQLPLNIEHSKVSVVSVDQNQVYEENKKTN